jgi:hypothetical protein
MWDWSIDFATNAAVYGLIGFLLLWIGWEVTRLVLGGEGTNGSADARAEALLRASIQPAQYEQLRREGYLEVPSTLFRGRCYRIPRNQARVGVFQDGRKIADLCVIACDPVPDADLVLTHKWMIEADEERYLKVANWLGRPTGYGYVGDERMPV